MGEQERDRALSRREPGGEETEQLPGPEPMSRVDRHAGPKVDVAAALDMLSDDSLAYASAEGAGRTDQSS